MGRIAKTSLPSILFVLQFFGIRVAFSVVQDQFFFKIPFLKCRGSLIKDDHPIPRNLIFTKVFTKPATWIIGKPNVKETTIENKVANPVLYPVQRCCRWTGYYI